MKENWFAILMFSIVFGVLGFLLGSNCCHKSDCSSNSCTQESSHQNSKCDKSTCDYSKKGCSQKSKSCSSKKHHKHNCGGGEDNIEVIVSDLGEDFIGDTTIVIDGGEVSISKSEDGEMRVEVEIEEEGNGDEEVIITKEIQVSSGEE